ncbi:MAG: hypothetical protein J0L84_02085 [Verrucomicrobia bacterium]|nr:hypothetical protein [Verrucomicrobiota bacterium]
MDFSRAQMPADHTASLPGVESPVLADVAGKPLAGDDTGCARELCDASAGMLPGEIPGGGNSADGAAFAQAERDCHHETPAEASSPLPPAPAVNMAPPPGKTARQYQEAYRRHELVVSYQQLKASGLSPDQAAEAIEAMGMSASRSTLDRYERSFMAGGFGALFDNFNKCGRKPKKETNLTPKQAAAARAHVLADTNRNATAGSVPEAIRLMARTGELTPEQVEIFRERERQGLMVPEALNRKLQVAPAMVQQHRSPKRGALGLRNAPGTTMFLTDERTGKERPVRVGDILEADDATVNFPVCVPWEMGGDPCSERWGVKVARFQWLVTLDRASRYIPGWSYTMRPRSSYRAEDIVSLFHAVFRQHGIWQRASLERGAWEADVVEAMLKQLRVERIVAWNPNQKPYIEALFNTLWTKLAHLPGQVGRFQGEEEATNRVLTSCQRGATDPRQHFPMLSQAVEALQVATQEKNRTPIHSRQYGSWVPEERWLAQQEEARATGRLRPLPKEAAWLFAPCMREWAVRGNTVGGTVQVMEGTSVRFDFAGDWLTEFSGCKVRVHFDPMASRADATIVLAQNVRDRRAGEVIGTAVQVNKAARYARHALGYGDDPDLAVMMRKKAGTALRREVRTILAGAQQGLSVSEGRDGEGNAVVIQRGAPEPAGDRTAEPQAPTRLERELTPKRKAVNSFRTATPEEFEAQGNRLARLTAARRRQETLA